MSRRVNLRVIASRAFPYRITIDGNTQVYITPAVDEDVWHVLDSCRRDTEAALDAADVGPTIASVRAVWTVH